MVALLEWIEDFWYVKIKKLHKHDYKRISDGKIPLEGFQRHLIYSRYQCTKCGNIVGLDAWQIASLPTSMKYQSADDILKEMRNKGLVYTPSLPNSKAAWIRWIRK